MIRLCFLLIFLGSTLGIQAQEMHRLVPSQGIYHPERTKKNDLIHTKLELRLDWKKQYLNGVATITFKPHFYQQNTLELDAKGFDVQKVTMKGQSLKYDYDKRVLTINLGKSFTRKDTAQVQITYVAKPNELPTGGSDAITADKGLYFINADGADPDKPRQIWTQGETEANSCWFPTIDTPNQKTTLEIFITLDKASVDAKFVTLSNGKLISSKVNSDGTRTDYWRQDKPAAPYLTMIAVGDFRKVIDPTYKNFEVSYYVEPKFEKYAMNIFGRTPEMISYFESLLGVKYQWDKYSQIAVREYVSGAMENTTATVHGDFIQKDNHQLIDDNDDGVIAHELFHHWFGDLVTCESWSNLPLNESFANYSEYLWTAYKYGQDEADLVAYIAFNQYFGEAQEKQEPLIRYRYNDKEDMFDSHSYAKGGRILHMLRKQVGDEAFFAALKLYLTQNAFKTAELDQLRLAFESVTGEDLHWFFNQWFLKPGHPDLQLAQEYANGKLKLTINQIQDTTYAPIYRLQLPIEVWANNQKTTHEVVIDKATQTFEWPLSATPQMVLLDPENVLVGRILHQKTPEEYVYQYYHAERVPARLLALEILTYQPDDDSTAVNPALDKNIRKVLLDATKDKFWRIRQLAVQKLNDYDGDDFLEVERALQSRVQIDDRSYVRADAILAMKGFQNAQNDKLFRQALNDTSYTVQAAALEAILASRPPDADQLALKYEQSNITAIFAAVGGYYSEAASPEKFNWFYEHLSKMNGSDLYQVLGIFGTYLVKSAQDVQKKSLPLLKKIAMNDTQWYVRFAGMQTLALLTDIPEGKTLLKEVIKSEKDERLRKVYSNTKICKRLLLIESLKVLIHSMNRNLKDGLNFFSKVTPARAWNALKNISSYVESKMTGKSVHRGLPIAISIEPTTSCNLRCPECPSGLRSFTRPTGMLEEKLFKQTIDELSETLLYLIFYFQGEPYLHPKFLDLVKYASQKGIYTATSTNAHYLSDANAKRTVESGLDRMIISIDGTTQDVYQQYRVGGSLSKVIEGARNIVKWKKELKSSTPHVIFQFLVVKPNEHQLEEVKQLAAEIGVDEIAFKTAQIYDYENGSDLIPTIDKYARYAQQVDGTYKIKNKLLDHCWKMWHSCVITWDGLVVPCCFDKDGEYRLGDLKQSSFKNLWQSSPYQDFRQSLIRSRSEIEMCKNCTEGTKVWG